MVFDGTKGTKKKHFQPNPRKVELPKNASIADILNKTNELYFDLEDIHQLSLADANGMMIEVEDCEKWKLDHYFSTNNYQPSRHKMYVMNMRKDEVKRIVYNVATFIIINKI